MQSKRIQFFATVFSILAPLLHFSTTLFLLAESENIVSVELHNFLFSLIPSTAFILITIAWISGSIIICGIVLALSCLSTYLIILNSGDTVSFFYIFFYCLLWFFLFLVNRQNKNELVETSLVIEKDEEIKNKLSETLENTRREVEVDFSKYSNYFKLREVADQFATSLSLAKVTRLIVDQTVNVLDKGDDCLLYLTDLKEHKLSLVASKVKRSPNEKLSKTGTIFDQWVLKSQQHLIIADAAKDFRFDYQQDKKTTIKSLIAAPLVNEGRVIGTLRLNSAATECFSTDDLRILNILATLASSAIWNALLYKQTEELAIRDSLTNLFVHRYFKERLIEEHRRSLLTNAPLSLLMCDLDHFKKYNDKHGHAAGDLVLKTVAAIFKEKVKEAGIIARYGGEEFAVILPNTKKQSAENIAEGLRKAIEEVEIDLRGSITKITVSIGIAVFPKDTLDGEELIQQADRRLYDAKKKGRNQVCS